jgi:uncharacterized membrane protein YfcA
VSEQLTIDGTGGDAASTAPSGPGFIRVFGYLFIAIAGWAIYVTLSSQWDTVLYQWRTSFTMVFGAFVAGSTPQGGGSVAFPVFTKVFESPAALARTFSLCVQVAGMGSATLSILLAKRSISKRAVLVGGASGVVGLVVGLFVLGDPSTVWWSSIIPEEYVKVMFTLVLAGMAYIVYLALDETDCGLWFIPVWNSNVWVGLILFGFAGGVASSLIGSGADVMVFLFVVIVAGLHPRIGVPTSVIVMTIVSIAGMVILGIAHGQLSTEVVDNMVVAVGGTPIEPVPALQYDLWGMWLAGAPAAAISAPIGAAFIHRLGEKHLINFLISISLLEVVTTAIFLEQLRTDPVLLAVALAGLPLVFVCVWLIHRYRDKLLGSAAPSITAAKAREEVLRRRAAAEHDAASTGPTEV